MCTITTAMLLANMGRIAYHRMDKEDWSPSVDLETTFDRFMGGCLVAAQYACARLDDLLDWDKVHEMPSMGCFSYSCLEIGKLSEWKKAETLPAFLHRELSKDDWYELADNHLIPATFEDTLLEWIKLVNLPLKSTKSEQFLVKVQFSLNAGPRMALIYDRSRAWSLHREVLADLVERYKDREKIFLFAHLENDELVLELDDEQPDPGW